MSRVLKTGTNQITYTYAEHCDKVNRGQGWAKGVDIVKNYNQCDWITAHTDGTVIKVVDYLDGTNGVPDKEGMGYGNYVMIEHRDRLVTLYAHLEKVQVKEGQKVAKGTVLGFMGNTGVSLGAHLHFEVRGYKEPITKANLHNTNAFNWLNAQAYVDIDLPVHTPTPKPTPQKENYYESTIPERFKAINKDGKCLNTYTYYKYAVPFADKHNCVIIDRLYNKEIYPEKAELTATSYPDYTGSDYYRVRKSFNDESSSKGSFQIWRYAFNTWNDNEADGYHVYDKDGKQLD